MSAPRELTDEERAALALDPDADLEELHEHARAEEQRQQAEHEAGYLGNGAPVPEEAYVFGQLRAALNDPAPSEAVLRLFRDPAFVGAAQKLSPAARDVVIDYAKKVKITKSSALSALSITVTESTAKPPKGSIGRPDPDLDESPQDTGELLTELAAAFRRFLVLPEGAAEALALWALHTWVLDCASYTPRLAVTSPTKRCAKSRVLEVLNPLCRRSLGASSLTSAVMFRAIEAARPTLLVDEADTFMHDNEELRGVMNDGYHRNGQVLRCVGDDHAPTPFRCFAAVAIAAIGTLPGTIMDRAITIRMQRKPRGLKVEGLTRRAVQQLEAFRPRLARWAEDAREDLNDAEPMMPGGLNDRQHDICAPLVAIADLAGGKWSELARWALVRLCAASEEDADDMRERALADVWEQFRSSDFLTLKALVEAMLADDSAGWDTVRKGKPMDTGTLSRWMRSYGVMPDRPWDPSNPGKRLGRGYLKTTIQPIADRYLSPPVKNGGPRGPQGPTPTYEREPDVQLRERPSGPPGPPISPRNLAYAVHPTGCRCAGDDCIEASP